MKMKTHRETGDPGCRAVILKQFCSTAFFWKLDTFITLHHAGNKFQEGRTPYIDIFYDEVA